MNKWRKHLTAGSVVLALGVASMIPSLALAETNSYGDQGNQDTGADSNQHNMDDMNGSSGPSSNGYMGSGNDMNSGNNMGSGMSHGNLSKQEVMQIQQALNQSGNQAGNHLSVDGIMGPNTQSALKEYQQSHGLQATGQPDSQTLQELGVNQNQ